MDFKTYSLNDIGDIVSGATPKTSDPDNFGGDIAWITPADLSGYSEKYISHGARNITQKGYDSCSTQLMPAGTVLFSSRAPIGYVAIAKNPICTNQGFKSIVPKSFVNSEFLYYQLIYLRKSIQDMGSGTTFKEISAKRLGTVCVKIPSLTEQTRIVARIEELFSQLDASVNELIISKERLKVYQQAILKETFDAENADNLVELSEIVKDIRIGPFGTMLHREDYVANGIPVINPKHIKRNRIIPNPNISITKSKASELAAYSLFENDIIMGRRGEMGRCAAVTAKEAGWICGTGSILIRLKSDFDALLYSKILSSPKTVQYLEEHAIGTTMKNLNESIIKRIPVPRITRDQQQSIIANLDAKLSICIDIEKTVDTALQQTNALRQTILKKAFVGGL